MNHLVRLACAAALAVASVVNAQATTTNVTQNAQWYAFDVDDQISGPTDWIDLLDNIGDPLSFSFSLAAPTFLRVIDAGHAGDRFNVHIFDGSGTLTLQTGTAVDSFPASVFNDYDAAWGDIGYSRLNYLLGPGTYTITGDLFVSAGLAPLSVTTGAIMLAAPVPEPSEWLLMLAGLGALGAYTRRSRDRS